MRLALLYVQTSREAWVEQAEALYSKKLGPFFPFEVVTLKSKAQARAQASEKVAYEQEKILSSLSKDDWVVLLDERGKLAKDSVQFSNWLSAWVESGKKRVVFVIGGAFGVGEQVRQRADALISLSPLTMSHHVAKVMCLEQVYRALTIRQGLPYHNS